MSKDVKYFSFLGGSRSSLMPLLQSSRHRIGLTFVLIFLFALPGCSTPIANLDSSGKNVICFGNSITAGTGAGPGEDYPSILQKKISLPVINAGVPGETTRDALRRIQDDVLSKNPKIVIVEFGGNDYLKKIPREETFRNLEDMVVQIQNSGAVVAIATIRTGLFYDLYAKGFKRIARKRKALLVPDIMRDIFNNPSLKSDYIHPNAQGYKLMAQKIYEHIEPIIEKNR